MRTAQKSLLLPLLSFSLAAFLPTLVAQDPVATLPEQKISLAFTEWPVPWENSRPRDPYKAPDGTIWFVGQTGDYIAHLDPRAGDMSRFNVRGTGPHTVVVDSEGAPWFAANQAGYIGKLNPATGEVERYQLPDDVTDPHTFAWNSDGHLWFTVQRAGYVGKLDPASGDIQVIKVPGSRMRPYGIVVDTADQPWFACLGNNAIGKIDPAEMQVQLFETPDDGSRIRRIGVSSDGRVWWTDAARGYLGVYNPHDNSMKQWLSPGGYKSALYAMAIDHKDRVWYAETGVFPNRIVGFDPSTESFISINEVPSGGTSVRNMIFDPESKSLWFGTDTNTIVRATIPSTE